MGRAAVVSDPHGTISQRSSEDGVLVVGTLRAQGSKKAFNYGQK